MRIPTLAVTMVAAAAAVVALPTAANAAPPVAVNDAFQAQFQEPEAVNVLTNDAANAGNAGKTLTVTTLAPAAAHGTVSCTAAGVCTYTPAAAWTGQDTFNYTVSDGTENAQGTVTVTTFNVDSVANLITKPGTEISATSVKWPTETLDIATIVRDTSGAGLQGVEATLFAKPSGGEYAAIFTGTSNANGRVATTGVRPVTRTSYQWRTAGTNSAARSVGVAPSLTATYGTKRLSVGDTTTVSGETSPATVGQQVVLERLNSTGTWTVVQTDTVETGSASTAPGEGSPFSFTISPETSRSDQYRVSVDGAETGRSDVTSAITKVKAYQADVTGVEPGTAEDQDEYVTVKNTGNVAIELKNWVLSDADSTVTLPKRTLAADATLKIHSEAGNNSLKHLYLGGPRNWANGGGTITLTDANAHVIEAFEYPVVAP